MTARLERLLAHDLGRFEQRYGARDTILYALGCGAGAGDLALVWERGLVALPTMATVLCSPARWLHDPAGLLDGGRSVHASERVELPAPLPASGHVAAHPRVVEVHDKGEGRGALVVLRRELRDAATGAPVATVTTRVFYRGDGGIGGTGQAAPVPAAIPDREPDQTVPVPTSPRAAAIYRLSGDDNPLHIDPGAAGRAGFPGPILHGLSTYGHVARSVLAARPGAGLQAMECRFSAPVYPGERLEIDLWDSPGGCRFRARVGERRVIDNGEMDLA